MNQRDRAQRRLNAHHAKLERAAIARRLEEEKKSNDRKLRAQTTEAVGYLSSWTQQIIADNERRGLSVGC